MQDTDTTDIHRDKFSASAIYDDRLCYNNKWIKKSGV